MTTSTALDRNPPANLPAGRRQFASDNYAGICPEAWQALHQANQGHARSYGDDDWTAAAADRIREVFAAPQAEVFFTFNGTAANALALASLCQSYHSILCHEAAHVETDECGAPEFFSNGTKVLLVAGAQGKIAPGNLRPMVTKRSDIHYPKPRVVSLTQATELGTVYSLDELRRLRDEARALNLAVHMDGARFANAVASLGCKPKDVIAAGGVDVLCLGGTKNGLPVGEAAVFFSKALAHEFDYRCKQAGQLASKMRFLAAPWLGILKDGVWLKHAGHANAMAAQLERALRGLGSPLVTILYPRQANSVFVEMPPHVAEALHQRGWWFYSFIGGGQRLMCAWDTQPSDIEAFMADFQAVLRG